MKETGSAAGGFVVRGVPIVWRALMVTGLLVLVDVPTSAGIRQTAPTLTADPAVTHGAGRTKTTITWATGDGTVAEVYVSIGGGPEVLFAGESTHGRQDADWIEPGTLYEFRLYAGTDHQRLLSTVLVTRLADSSGAAQTDGDLRIRQIVNVTLFAALLGCAGLAGRIAVLRNRQEAKKLDATVD
jgi:hypothetical protein